MIDQISLTADLIHGFTTAFLMDKFDDPVPTPDLHLELWDLMCKGESRVAAAAPRGHAKSTAITHAFVLANVCFRRARHVMIVSDTEGQAVDFLRGIKQEIEENSLLREAFGIRRTIKDNEKEIIVQFDDKKEFRIICKGSMQKVRGTTWRNMRPDLIVCDDLENDEIVMNEERRNKFLKWFYNALLQCGTKTSRIRVVGTILHLDSLLERLMPKIGSSDTKSTELYDLGHGQQDTGWLSVRYKAHNEDFSKILWPEQFSKERLVSIRQSFIDQGFPEGYSQEYLNYPIDEGTAYFKKKDFRPIEEDGAPEQYYVAVDLAISTKKARAYSVFVVVGVTPAGELRVRDVLRFRGDSLNIIDELFLINKAYDPEVFFIEQENIARALGPVLNKEMVERNTFFNIQMMPPIHDKVQRARSIQARMRAGNVFFETDADWFADFQTELIQFPRGAYKDQVDSFAWIGLGLDSIYESPTQDELDDEEYEDEYSQSYDSYDFGCSSITGY